MICAIMQPTYLPWAGYFNLISQSDVFVFLDDAQFQKNSWHNRNRILVNHLPHWITLPVRHAALCQTIRQTELDDSKNWRRKHIKLLQHTYCKHPFLNEILDVCNILEQENFDNLAELNIKIIIWFLKKLEINTKVCLSSQMDLEGKRVTRIIRILQQLKADTYLSPNGATEYLNEDRFVDQTAIHLTFQEFKPYPYTQYRHDSFESHLSLVDVVANIGWDATKQYIERFS